ncbi:MAG: hypothetical protein RIG63_18580 [Coleofasciculus chthonoplastes F3-SA18-01]
MRPPLQIPGLPRDRIPSIPTVRSLSPSRLALIPDQKSDRLKHTSILSQGGFC